jgi:hypothetical protein
MDELRQMPDAELKRVCALSVIEEYLGAIDMLVELVREGKAEQAKDEGVVDMVDRLGKVRWERSMMRVGIYSGAGGWLNRGVTVRLRIGGSGHWDRGKVILGSCNAWGFLRG